MASYVLYQRGPLIMKGMPPFHHLRQAARDCPLDDTLYDAPMTDFSHVFIYKDDARTQSQFMNSSQSDGPLYMGLPFCHLQEAMEAKEPPHGFYVRYPLVFGETIFGGVQRLFVSEVDCSACEGIVNYDTKKDPASRL